MGNLGSVIKSFINRTKLVELWYYRWAETFAPASGSADNGSLYMEKHLKEREYSQEKLFEEREYSQKKFFEEREYSQ